MADEWIRLTPAMEADSGLADALAAFRALDTEAGRAAEQWLKERAFAEADHIATWVRLDRGQVSGYHSLSMGEVELQTRQRKPLRASHVRQGAVLIFWIALSVDSDVDGETILRHAVGLGRLAAQLVGAIAIAADPYDEELDEYWRERAGFRTSATAVRGAHGEKLKRLWQPLGLD